MPRVASRPSRGAVPAAGARVRAQPTCIGTRAPRGVKRCVEIRLRIPAQPSEKLSRSGVPGDYPASSQAASSASSRARSSASRRRSAACSASSSWRWRSASAARGSTAGRQAISAIPFAVRGDAGLGVPGRGLGTAVSRPRSDLEAVRVHACPVPCREADRIACRCDERWPCAVAPAASLAGAPPSKQGRGGARHGQARPRGHRALSPCFASLSRSLVRSSSPLLTRRRPRGCGPGRAPPGGNGRVLPDQVGLATLAGGGERRPRPRKGLRRVCDDGGRAVERLRSIS